MSPARLGARENPLRDPRDKRLQKIAGPCSLVIFGVTGDLDVPGQAFTFGHLIAAQAAGDAQVLADHGRPVLRLHLTDRTDGVRRLLEVLQ